MPRIAPHRRPILLLLAFFCLFSAGPRPTPASASEPVRAAFIHVKDARDQGWTAAHHQGVEAMKRRLGEAVQVESVENVDTPAQAETVLRDLAARDFDIIFATSLVHAGATEKVAREYPGVRFMQCSGRRVGSNLGAYTARMEQAEYLAGYAAGLMGFRAAGTVATLPEPEVVRGINAFTLGLLRGLGEAKATHDPAKVNTVVWLKAWRDPVNETTLAETLAGRGHDLIRQMADTPDSAKAACAKGVAAVGYCDDVARYGADCALVSTVFHWGRVYVDQVRKVLDGTWKPVEYFGGMEDGVVGLSPFGKAVPQAVRDKVQAVAARMEKGQDESFAGPILDQSGKERIAAGQKASDKDLLTMQWFVKGVGGKLPN